ncbi:HNH endonuclease signature motif containing protein [Pseudonocardia eucalypti]
MLSVPVPDLEDRALDAELYAFVTSLDPDRVANRDVPAVLAAVSRLHARLGAFKLGWINEVTRRAPNGPPDGVDRLREPHRFGPDEVRVTLAWSRQRAERDSSVAHEVITLLPDVYAAWSEGRMDEAKARICHTYLANLTAPERAAVWAAVAPRVAGWNSGQLAARLRKLTLGGCPERVEERYARAVEARRAVWFLSPDGTACLALDGVAPGDAAAAKKRITALARRLRRAGAPGTLDQLRADITLALLDGTLDGLTSEQILTHFRPATNGGRLDLSPTVRSDITPSGPAPRDPITPAVTQPSAAEPHAPEPDAPEPDAAGSDAAGSDAAGSDAAGSEATGPGGAGSRLGTDVVLELGTLIGTNQRPGELPDLHGAIPGHVARAEALNQQRGRWVVAVCDHEGYLLCCATLRARPDGALDRYRGGTVELRLTVTQLEYWLHDPPRGFEKLIAEIAARYRAWPQQVAGLNEQPDRRFPGSALRRWVEVRDQTCLGPGGCGRPARQSDKDHTQDVQHGGKTTDINLSPQCDHDHLLKTEGGWTLEQPEPGVLIWRSPLGQTYRTRGDPLIDPPPELDPDPPF